MCTEMETVKVPMDMKITLEKIEGRRPGIHIEVENLNKIVGKKIKQKIFKDEPLKKKHIS